MNNNGNLTIEEINDMIEVRSEPHIYAFSTNTIPNYFKVGDTFRPIEKRLDEWRKEYCNLKREFPKKGKESDALAKVNNDIYFRDYSIHKYLKDNLFNNLSEADFKNLVGSGYYSNEFFKDVTIEELKKAIQEVKQDFSNANTKYTYYKLVDKKPSDVHWKNDKKWTLRSNQKEVVENFVEKVQTEKELLMYAVMRFGKSFTALSCASVECPEKNKQKYKKVLVVSAKADVVDEWKKTVEMPECFKDYAFLRDNNFKENPNIIEDVLNHNVQDEYLLNKSCVVAFLTLQNISGKDSSGNNIKKKLEKVMNTEFDMIIIDETHFGAWSEVYGKSLSSEEDKKFVQEQIDENKKFIDAYNNKLHAKVKLHLSGTPYNLLYDEKFTEKNIIATCQFRDILRDKEKWYENHRVAIDTGVINPATGAPFEEYDNPYFGFPKMLRFAFNLPTEAVLKLENASKSGQKWTLNDFLKTNEINVETKFLYENDVLNLLKVIDGSKQDKHILSFLDIPAIKENNVCKHIVMVLPFKFCCDAMENLLAKERPMFKHLKNYKVLNITGHNLKPELNSVEKVKDIIAHCEQNGEKTITLTVQKMLTGVTVPEWDTMIMLKDTKSPQEYDQAIFRIQNQFVEEREEVKSGGTKILKIDKKPQTILVDFDPIRMFTLQGVSSRITDNIRKDEQSLEESIKEELGYFPIITYNADKLVKVEPTDLIQLITQYNNNKSIIERVQSVAFDKGLLYQQELLNYIRAQSQKTTENKLDVKAHDGEQTSDVQMPEDNDKLKESDVNTTGQTAEKKTDDDLEKKYRMCIARLCFYSFLTTNNIDGLKDIISSLDETCKNHVENQRIFNNLKLNLQFVKGLDQHLTRFFAIDVDNALKSANFMSHDETLTPIGRAQNAIKNFDRFSDAEIVTPNSICDNMIETIGKDTLAEILNRREKILDISSKAGEFACAIYNLLHGYVDEEKLKNGIYSIPTSGTAYEFTRRIYETLGLNVENISDPNKLTAYDLIKLVKIVGNDQIKKILTQNKPFSSISKGDTVSEEVTDMIKFGAVVGNPPYQETIKQTEAQTQANTTWIYQYFQFIADKLSECSCLIYPFGGWFDSPKSLSGLGNTILKDGHTILILAYEGTSDKRAWYRNDKSPNPIFVDNANLSAGISIVLRNRQKHESFEYSNRVYSDERVTINVKEVEDLTPNPLFIKINKKLGKNKLVDRLNKSAFNIESNFAELNPDKVSLNKKDWEKPILLLTNDKSGSKGRTKPYYTDINNISKGREYVPLYKVIITSAYPKQKLTSGRPTVANVKRRIEELVEILEPNSAFGKSRMALFMSKEKTECENFVKYLKTNFVAALVLQEPNRRSTIGSIIPNQDFSSESDIDWSKDIEDLDKQLYKKYNLSQEEINFIETNVKPME